MFYCLQKYVFPWIKCTFLSQKTPACSLPVGQLEAQLAQAVGLLRGRMQHLIGRELPRVGIMVALPLEALRIGPQGAIDSLGGEGMQNGLLDPMARPLIQVDEWILRSRRLHLRQTCEVHPKVSLDRLEASAGAVRLAICGEAGDVWRG